MLGFMVERVLGTWEIYIVVCLYVFKQVKNNLLIHCWSIIYLFFYMDLSCSLGGGIGFNPNHSHNSFKGKNKHILKTYYDLFLKCYDRFPSFRI